MPIVFPLNVQSERHRIHQPRTQNSKMWFVNDVVAKQNGELKKEKDRLDFLTTQLGREKATLFREKSELELQKTNLEQKLQLTQESLKRSTDGKLFLKLDLESAKNEFKRIEKRLRDEEEKVFFWRGRAMKSANDALDARMQANNSMDKTLQRSREWRLKAEIQKQKTLNASQVIQIQARDDKIRDLERIAHRRRVELERRLQEVRRVEDEMEEIVETLSCRGINLYEGRTFV